MKTAARNSLGQFEHPPPPDLEFRCPECPFCMTETDTDGDSFVCYGCEASWSMDGTRGSWLDSTALACPVVIEWHNTDRLEAKYESIRHHQTPCILPDDHGGEHRGEDSWYLWDDEDPRVVKRGSR